MDQKLKERVFGALVVVAIAVIFVPMLLDKKHDEAVNISEAIPTPPIEDTAFTEPPQRVAEMEDSLTAEKLANMFGFDYAIASDESSLEAGIKTLYSNNSKPFILEIFTPTRKNDTILLQFFKELV